jgi:hypothetical protein
MKRKMWLLWTVPALSLLTCGLVFGYATFGEGFSAKGRTETLTILDETNHRATTIGLTGFYSPLTPSGGLHFSTQTEVSPELGDSQDYRYSRRRPDSRLQGYSVDWTTDQHLTGPWVQARVPAHFAVRKCSTQRERLVVRRNPDGSMTATNGLGAAIEQLYVADASGRLWEASNIAAGAEATLATTSRHASAKWGALRQLLGGGREKTMRSPVERPEEFLVPNSYAASLESCPFLEQALGSVRELRQHATVVGFMKDPMGTTTTTISNSQHSISNNQ